MFEQLAIFQGLPQYEVNHALERFRALDVEVGTELISEGDEDPTLVIVVAGELEISTGDVEAALRILLERGVPLRHLRIRPRNLEDLFLELTGRELRT